VPAAGVKRVITSLENVGQLPQTSAPVAGKSYWMAFLNTGRLVKRGDRVGVVIGPFRAAGGMGPAAGFCNNSKPSDREVSMFRVLLAMGSCLAVAVSFAAPADNSQAAGNLTAAEIMAKNVAARGGLEAWRAVKTPSVAGKMGAGGNQRPTLATPAPRPRAKLWGQGFGDKGPPMSRLADATRAVEEVQLPFLMQMERPGKVRFELAFNGQTAIQVFDGTNVWKLRPFLNRLAVEPYTPEEMKTTATQSELDGLLVDYAAKGTGIELAGMEKVEDRDNYKIQLTLKNDTRIHVWIDAGTFLETKLEGQPTRLDATDHPPEIYLRGYGPVSGLQIPYVLETSVLPVGRTALGFRDPPVPPEKTVVETVLVNPKLDESRFSKEDIVAAANSR
jgi:hypothetical protein